ncbi:MAG: glycosyltransferase [Candidatus Eremiobacteraeota bacterium]|nr:glycosyltransferase [Candidatus Eremiobacteraeota bacterium]
MKLVLGIPTAGHPAAPFVESLKGLTLPPQITAIENKTVTGNFVPAQRELLVEFALARHADFLLMADDDMVVPPDAIARLLEPFSDPATGLTGALYYSRDGSRPMAVAGWDPNDTTGAAIPAFDKTPTSVDGVGFGLVMIRVSALAEMAAPFFPVQIYIERAMARVRVCNEDYLFCKRLRDAGWNVLLHPGVRCGHFDRDSGKTHPLVWETSVQTNSERMMVRKPDGSVGMQSFDGNVGRSVEAHKTAALEYLFVD